MLEVGLQRRHIKLSAWGTRCRQWSRSFERRNIKVLASGSCCQQRSGSFRLRNIKDLVSEAAGAGNGFEDLEVQVSSFRPGAPAAGSGLEDSCCDAFRPGPAIRCRWSGGYKRRSSKLSAWDPRCRKWSGGFNKASKWQAAGLSHPLPAAVSKL